MNSQNIIYSPHAFLIVINVRGYYKAPPHVNGIMGFFDHCFAFYISDRKQYILINGFDSNLNNIYGVHKGLGSGCHSFLTYISGLYEQ